MRTNGDGGERFTARFTAEARANEDEDAEREERDVAKTLATMEGPAPAGPSRGSKGPKSRVKKGKSQPPKSAEKPVAKQAERASQRPGKRGKGKSVAPKPRPAAVVPAPAPAHTPAPASVTASRPAPASLPPSLDPRTTLRDHPVQKSAAAAARAATTPRRDDEISIPPTSSDPPAAGDLDDRFFAEGEAAARAAHAEAIHATKVGIEPFAFHAGAGEPDAHDAGRRVVFVPPERRRKLTNYVKLAVGFSAVLLLAAAVRVGMSHVRPTEAAAAVAPVVAVVPAAAPPQAPPPPAAAVPVEPAAAPPVTAVVEPPPPVPVDEPAVAAEPAPPAKTAKQEKEDARKALERGKRKDAIDSAQRSVDLDPTDAEAWLILGSAQQDSGKWKDAHESFASCAKQAKSGPVGECRMMLR